MTADTLTNGVEVKNHIKVHITTDNLFLTKKVIYNTGIIQRERKHSISAG